MAGGAERDHQDDIDRANDAHDREHKQDQHAPRVRSGTLLLGKKIHRRRAIALSWFI